MSAVTLGTPGERALRVGVLGEGAIRDERVHVGAVTIGRDEGATIALAGSEVPGRFEIFRRSASGWVLRFPAHARGRVAMGAQAHELGVLVADGHARQVGQVFELPLQNDARGKVVIGSATLLFQLVVPPPARSRPRLPSSVRNGILGSVDWVFTSFVLASFVAHFGVVTLLESSDSPLSSSVSELPPEVARLVFDPVAPPPPSSDAPDVAPAASATPASPSDGPVARNDRAHTARTPRDHGDRSPTMSEADRARIEREAIANATALLVGGAGEGPGSTLDRLLQGAALADAADVMAQVRAVQIAGPDDAFRPRGGGTSQISGDLRGLRRAGGPVGPLVEGNPGGPTEVRIRVRVEPDDGGMIFEPRGPEFPEQQVQRAVRSRLRAIQACYEHRLTLNPALAGKVDVEFTIEEVGSVSRVHILENTTGDSGMNECVAAPIRSLRFNPGPVGGSVTISYPFIFARQR